MEPSRDMSMHLITEIKKMRRCRYIYVKETIQFKRRTDIEKRFPTMEHLWFEIPGRNKHSKLLLGTVLQI